MESWLSSGRGMTGYRIRHGIDCKSSGISAMNSLATQRPSVERRLLRPRIFQETIAQPVQRCKLQTPVSRGNMYKVNIESAPGSLTRCHWASPRTLNIFSECEEPPIQQGERLMQIRAVCIPGARPRKCIKLIAMQNGCYFLSPPACRRTTITRV